ncbi:hypothetical protein ACA910_005497 [Epithemia clementina (nom. ined.)]
MIEPVMDCLGTDDIRIIITHVDTSCEPCNQSTKSQLRSLLSDQLNVPAKNIALFSKTTNGSDIEAFVLSTLHRPIKFQVSESQMASIASLAVVRSFNKPISIISKKIQAAATACEEAIEDGKSYATDVIIVRLQALVSNMVAKEKEEIFRKAFESGCSDDVQTLVYGRAGVSLSLKLRDFVKATNISLSWDVTDPWDPRNQYRQCPNCDAVYVKIGGCETIVCGDLKHVPEPEIQTTSPMDFEITFEQIKSSDYFTVRFVQEGKSYNGKQFASQMRNAISRLESCFRQFVDDFEEHLAEDVDDFEEHFADAIQMQAKLGRANKMGERELNIFCGKETEWSHMLPIPEERLVELGEVPLAETGVLEKISRRLFHCSINDHKGFNQDLLDKGLRCNQCV